MARTWFDRIAMGVGIFLLIISIFFLRHLVRDIDLSRIGTAISGIAVWQIMIAIGLTVLSFLMIIGFEYAGTRYARLHLPLHTVAYTGAVGEAFNNVMNLSLVGVGAARLRLYRRWGITPQQFSELVAFVGLSSWFGFVLLGGLALLLVPTAQLAALPVLSPLLLRGIATLFLLSIAIYLGICIWKSSFKLFQWRIPIPSWPRALHQISFGFGDWVAQALILYVLFPQVNTIPLLPYLAAFTVAMFVAIAGHVPAGLGVFDSGSILLMAQFAPKEHIIGALILFRLIYHVIPFVLATLAFGRGELSRWYRTFVSQ